MMISCLSRTLPFALACLLSAGILHAQEREATLQDLRVDVVYLSADLLEGRATGTPGEALAARYIATRFDELGLAPAGTDEWFQPFDFRYAANPHAPAHEGEPRTGRNVVGFLDHGAGRTVVIGAHYDHLGYGGFGSRQPGDSLIHNGADDNASGVAALFEMARQLKQSEARQNDYLFVAFSGEELGLYGSKHFVRVLPASVGPVNYMINLDMVGRLNDERALAVNGSGTSPAWDAALDAATATNLVLNKHASGLGPSDHASFYLEDIPVLHLFTGQHADYHKSTDDSERINYTGIYDVASFAVDVIEALDDDGALAFTKTKDEDQSNRTAFKVSLGIMPDYVSSGGEGLRIDAVMDDRPAAQAGLLKGDVIIRLGDVEVTDINAYMEALAQFKEGDTAMVVVKRGGEVIEADVHF